MWCFDSQIQAGGEVGVLGTLVSSLFLKSSMHTLPQGLCTHSSLFLEPFSIRYPHKLLLHLLQGFAQNVTFSERPSVTL